MSISGLRTEVRERLVAFAWDQWSQLGVLASTDRRDRWAIDPEALVLFTLEIARDDPRLFDEGLDWMVVNERLMSVQRLRNLVRDDADRALLDATLGWVARWRPRARLSTAAEPDKRRDVAEPLFRTTRIPTQQLDEAFLAHGFLKTSVEPSRNSQPPDPALPANFAFRLRHLLGIGARAEAVRVLLGVDAPRVTAQVVAESAGYTKRNVHEALAALRAAGVLEVIILGNEQRFSVPRERWAALLGMQADELPRHRDWPALLYALRRIARWLADPRNEALSDYMRASEARQLVEEIATDLRVAGVPIPRGRPGPEYWEDFVSTVGAALASLE
jgi:DNA-binding transcriptional ArsR family regulator